eukprot:TRINITY_DN19324_c0_g2_i1.p1 TRINITY_DN19324_c0_g2~~TRINITY_DN19324_c0_g2_i1.p1  ORF type:complete len:461 (+),score=62.09 TRINITY_DN19324_c0_g2_i1:69-1385(+)
MTMLRSMQQQSFARKADKRTSTCESLSPLLGVSLASEATHAESCSEWPSLQDDVNDTSTSSNWERSSGEEGVSSSSIDSTLDDVSNKALDIKPPAFAKPSGRRPWARAGMIDKQPADAIASRATDCNVVEVNDIESGVADEPLHACSEKAATKASKARRWYNVPKCTTSHGMNDAQWEAENFEQPSIALAGEAHVRRLRRLSMHDVGSVPDQSKLAAEREQQSHDGQQRLSASEVDSDAGRPSSAKSLTSQNHDGPRILHASKFASVPGRSSLIEKRPPQNSTRPGSSNRANSARGVSSNVAMVAPQAAAPQASAVVVLNKSDAKGSGMQYNLVQFKATPTLSTSCGSSKRNSTPRASTSKTAETPQVPYREEALDPQSATEGILSLFGGWSKHEVKEMLRDKYSSAEIAEVLQVLKENEPRKTRRSRSKQSSRSSRA